MTLGFEYNDLKKCELAVDEIIKRLSESPVTLHLKHQWDFNTQKPLLHNGTTITKPHEDTFAPRPFTQAGILLPDSSEKDKKKSTPYDLSLSL